MGFGGASGQSRASNSRRDQVRGRFVSRRITWESFNTPDEEMFEAVGKKAFSVSVINESKIKLFSKKSATVCQRTAIVLRRVGYIEVVTKTLRIATPRLLVLLLWCLQKGYVLPTGRTLHSLTHSRTKKKGQRTRTHALY